MASRIFVPSSGPDSWRGLLAKPDLHWATGYSARTLANCWEHADGFPTEIRNLLQGALGNVQLLLAIPEHKTPLPGGRRESQSDVLAIGRHAAGLVVCAIEGKVDEAFGPTVAEQMTGASPGRTERFAFLCATLGIGDCPGEVRYQLLHRTASALIEAERFAASHAAMVIHSFSPEKKWFDAAAQFTSLFGKELEADTPVLIDMPNGRQLILGWACGDQCFRSM